ncbi:MAG TPA: PorV/PorQ family protein, partial [Bacteroidota bacterium]
SYARNLTDRFSIGFNAKFISERIWNETAHGIALDVGTLYTTPFNGLRLGATISNFGTKMRLDGQDLEFNYNPTGNANVGPTNVPSQYRVEDYDMPLTFRIGVSMEVIDTEGFRTTASIDATHPNDNVEYVNSGLEVAWRDVLFGRVGYKALFLRDSEQGLTWGIGLRFNIVNGANIAADYGFADYGRLDNVQFVTLSLEY